MKRTSWFGWRRRSWPLADRPSPSTSFDLAGCGRRRSGRRARTMSSPMVGRTPSVAPTARAVAPIRGAGRRASRAPSGSRPRASASAASRSATSRPGRLASGSSSRTGCAGPAPEDRRDVGEVRGLEQQRGRALGVGAGRPDPDDDRARRDRSIVAHDVLDAGVDRARPTSPGARACVDPSLVRLVDRVADERLVGRVEPALDLHDVDPAPAGGRPSPAADVNASPSREHERDASRDDQRERCTHATTASNSGGSRSILEPWTSSASARPPGS